MKGGGGRRLSQYMVEEEEMVLTHLAHLLLTIRLQLLFFAMSCNTPLPHHYHHNPTPLLTAVIRQPASAIL